MSMHDMKIFSNELKELFEKDQFIINIVYIGKYDKMSYSYFDVESIRSERIRLDFLGNKENGITLWNIEGVYRKMEIITNFLQAYNSKLNLFKNL